MDQKNWEAYCDRLKLAGKIVAQTWEANDPLNRAEFYRQLIMDIGLGYMLWMGSDPDYPDLMPFLNSVYMLQPNPDDTYYLSRVRGDRPYRLSGDRGSVHLLTVNIGKGAMGMSKTGPGGGLDEYNIGDMVALDGKLDILFSNERPAGYTGQWLKLDPRADYILLRQRCYQWGEERDARLALTPAAPVPKRARLGIPEIDVGINETLDFTERVSKEWIEYLDKMRKRLQPNVTNFTGFSEWGGVRAQIYWEGIFEFDADEALILETELPEKVRYWNIQLNDSLFNTIDYLYCHSSLNGHQAKVDSDGKFRAVICLDDPGIANWLDPQERRLGTYIGRWYESSSRPVPTVKRVKRADLFKHLPADTPRVTPTQRQEIIMERVRGGQIRRRW